MNENYKPKVVRCRLKTGGKTVQELREKLTGQGFTVRDFQNIIKAGDYFDGLEVQVSMWNWDNHESWHLWNWKEEDDEKVMMAMYHAEQFHPYARIRKYKDNFEQFQKDWKAQEYEADASYTFDFDEVEVLEVIQEEVNEIKTEEVEKAIRMTRAAKEQNFYRNRKRRRNTKHNCTYRKRRR